MTDLIVKQDLPARISGTEESPDPWVNEVRHQTSLPDKGKNAAGSHDPIEKKKDDQPVPATRSLPGSRWLTAAGLAGLAGMAMAQDGRNDERDTAQSAHNSETPRAGKGHLQVDQDVLNKAIETLRPVAGAGADENLSQARGEIGEARFQAALVRLEEADARRVEARERATRIKLDPDAIEEGGKKVKTSVSFTGPAEKVTEDSNGRRVTDFRSEYPELFLRVVDEPDGRRITSRAVSNDAFGLSFNRSKVTEYANGELLTQTVCDVEGQFEVVTSGSTLHLDGSRSSWTNDTVNFSMKYEYEPAAPKPEANGGSRSSSRQPAALSETSARMSLRKGTRTPATTQPGGETNEIIAGTDAAEFSQSSAARDVLSSGSQPKVVAPEEPSKAESGSLEDRLTESAGRISAEERDAALRSRRLPPYERKVEAGDIVGKSSGEGAHKSGGVDKATGGAVGLALVGMALAQWYASYKSKQSVTEQEEAPSN